MMDANGMIEAIIFGGDGSGASTIEELTTSGGTSDAGKVLVVANDGSIEATTLPVSEGTVAIDTTLTITGAAPDSKVVGDALSAVNESLADCYIKPLSAYTNNSGAMGTSSWTNPTSAQYKHKAIPVKPGDVVSIRSSNTSRYFAFATSSYVAPTGAGSIPYSTVQTARIGFNAGIQTYTVPSDGAYLLIESLFKGTAVPITYLTINDYDLLASTADNLKQVVSDVGDRLLEDRFINGYTHSVYWNIGSCGQTVGEESSNNTTSTTRRRCGPYKSIYPLTVECPDRTYKTTVLLLDDNLIITAKYSVSFYPRQIPANTYFKVIIQDAEDDSTVLSGISSSEISTHVFVRNTVVADLLKDERKAKWAVMGDSISLGWHSEFVDGGGTESEVSVINGWAYKVRVLKKWDSGNFAVGSTGFLEQGNAGANDIGYVIARNTDYSTYDIVTLAYGINDWKGNNVVGTINDDPTTPTTVMGAMKATIEAIIASNPLIKIIGILPLNAWGYSHNYGDKSTNYGLGYEFSNSGTLESFVSKLKEVYEYYGIEYIDLTHASVVNRENLPTALPDGVHPSIATHTVLAREIAGKLNFE